MFVTIINDCKSENDIGRQETRYATLFPKAHITFVGVDSSLGMPSTMEAAGNLIDVLDASEGKEGVVAVNVAPRGQVSVDGENGSRFCFFWYKKTLIISTLKGYNLSLVKKFGLTINIKILETNTVLKFAVENKLINKNLSEYITGSQFRSFDFQPRAAKWLIDGEKLPYIKTEINTIADIPPSVWLIDSFGNIKTTLLYSDISNRSGSVSEKIKTNRGNFTYYDRLKSVPDGETAIYTGSSGIGNKRLLEIATQNRKGSAFANLNIKIGDPLLII